MTSAIWSFTPKETAKKCALRNAKNSFQSHGYSIGKHVNERHQSRSFLDTFIRQLSRILAAPICRICLSR